jgi:hypothetical protein
MWGLSLWAVAWTLFAGVMFICMCGDPSADGPCAFLARLVWGTTYGFLYAAPPLLAAASSERISPLL